MNLVGRALGFGATPTIEGLSPRLAPDAVAGAIAGRLRCTLPGGRWVLDANAWLDVDAATGQLTRRAGSFDIGSYPIGGSYVVNLLALRFTIEFDLTLRIAVPTPTPAPTPTPTPVATIAVSNLSAAEGDPATATVTATRNGLAGALSGTWAVDAGTGPNPANPADFGGTFPSGTWTIPAGANSVAITVTSSEDALVEPNETYRLAVSYNGVTSYSDGTIVNDDAATIAVSNLSAGEGDPATATVTATRNGVTGNLSGTWAVSAATGLNPADAADFGGTFPSGTWTIPAGADTATITVTSSEDTTVEPNEAYRLGVTFNGVTVYSDGTIGNDDAPPVEPPVSSGFRYQPDFGSVSAGSLLPAISGWTMTTTRADQVSKVSRMATTADNTLLCTATTDSGWNGTAADLYDHDQTHGVLQFTVLVRPGFGGRRLPPIIFSAADGRNWCAVRVYYDGTPRVSLMQFIKCVNGAISIVGPDIPISGTGDVTFRIRRNANSTDVYFQVALPNGSTLANKPDEPIAFGADAPFGDRIGFASEIYVEHRGEITNYIYADAISGPAGAQAREAFPDWTMQTSAVELALPGSATFAQPQMRMLSGTTVLSDWQAATPYQVIPKTDEPEWRILGPAIPSQYHEASVMLEYRDAAMPAVVARSAIIPKALPAPEDSMVGVNSGSYQDDNAPLNFVQTMLLRSAPTAGGDGSEVCHPQYVIDKSKTGALPASDFGITDGGMKIGGIPAGRNLDLLRDKSLMPRDPNDWLYKNANGSRRIHRALFTPGWYLKLRAPGQSAWVWSDAQGNPAAPNFASGAAHGYFRHSSEGGGEGVAFMLDHFDANLNNNALPADDARNGKVPPKADQYFRIVDMAIDWAGGRWTNPEANKWLAPFAGTVLRTMSAAKGWGGPVPHSLATLATGAQPAETESLDFVVWNYYNNVDGTRGILAREVTPDMEFTRDSLTWAAPNHVGIPVEAFIETANDFNMHLWPCDNNLIGDAATTARAQKYDTRLNAGRLVFAEKINEVWNPHFGFSAQHINYLAAKLEGKDTAQSPKTTGFPANHLYYVRLTNASFDRYKAVSATRFRKILLWQHAAVTQSLVDAMLGAATDRDKLSHFGSGAYNYGGHIGEYGSTVWSVASKDRLAGTAEERAASEEAAWQALEYTLQHVTLPSIVASHRCLDDWKRRNPGHDHIRPAQYEFSFQHSDKREAWPAAIDAQAIDLLYRMQVAPGWVRYGEGWYAMLHGLRKMGAMLAIYSGPGSIVSPGNVASGRWGILSSSGALDDEPYASIRRFMADHRGYLGAPQ